MTGQDLAERQEATKDLVSSIRSDQTRAQIEKVLPPNVSIDKFERVAVTAINENADLVTVDRGSLFLALVKCAQDGLLPDGREAALIPFNDKKRGRVANYLPMIGGYRKIAAEHGWTIRTSVVYENDEFDFELGDQPTVRHRPPRPGVDRGQKIAAYAVGAHADGRREVEVLDATDVAKIKATSKAVNYGPWVDWEERMWEKSAGRRLFKKLPISDGDLVQRILAADFTPAGSLTDLYGPGANALTNGSTSTADEARPDVSSQPPDPGQAKGTVGTDGGETGPQAASTLSSPPEGVGGSGPDEVDWTALDPEPPSEPETAQETRAAAAGEAVVPDGHFAGKTLTQVASTGKQGQGWLLNALKMLPTGDPTRTAVETYVRGEQPDVWAAFEEWQAAEQAGDQAFGDAA